MDCEMKKNCVAIIHKIKFGKKTDVDPRNYLKVYSQKDRWNSSQQFKAVIGKQFKLLLYDPNRKELTVQVNIQKIEQTNSEPGFGWSNVFVPGTWLELSPPIPVTHIDTVDGLSNFSRGRAGHWNIDASQYDSLFTMTPTDWQSDSAIEGHLTEGKLLSHTRNRSIVEKRKRKDNFTCQSCEFRLEINGRFIIDVHHLAPFRLADERITSIEDLVCLCPNCHRIADSSQIPYPLDKIREIRQANDL
jgi:hypothetical protein